ncbi:PspC domain-containing protein [Actinomyces israelii]|uniref:PspC domain-containing protein n=1 Tax=Actinomyces israelii TaxID=1659 RepID=A0ABT4I729_9ACTO|nr:PspC domain-containing protein [Actinomyces israelii]MCZ0857341.1 PspC domain-containing protein [Actinomyces israelii]
MSNSDIPPDDPHDDSGTAPPENDPSQSTPAAPAAPGTGGPTPRPAQDPTPGGTPEGGAGPAGAPPGGYAAGAGQWAYPPPRRGAASGFFDSIRRSGLVRTDQRWLGGVAGGVARRLGVDVTLVRCIWFVLSVFTGLGLVLYGLAWALLPEESDGRVHLQQALAGDMSAGLAGSVVVFLAGLASVDHGSALFWFPGGWHYFFGPAPIIGVVLWPLFWTGLFVGAIIWLVRSLRSRPTYGPQPHPGRLGRPGPAAGPGPAHPGRQQAAWAEEAHTARAAHTAPAGAPPAGMGPGTPPRPGYGPRPVPPPRPPVPGPGRTVSLLVIGLALIGLALAGLGRTTGTISAFQAVFFTSGGLIALLGGGVVVSALRGRRGGWMTGIGWPTLFATLPLVFLGSLMPPQAMNGPTPKHPVTIALTDADLNPGTTAYPVASDGTIDLGAYAAGSVTLDLRQVTREASSNGTAAVHLTVGAGRVLVKTREGQPVHVDGRAGLGVLTTDLASTWDADGTAADADRWNAGPRHWRPGPDRGYTVTGEELSSSRSWWRLSDERAGVTSPAAQDGRGRIDVDAEIGTGAIQIEESSSQTRWSGSTETATWVVDSWTDDNGYHDELPVAGMTHPAVSSDTADSCLDQVLDNNDDDDDDDNDGDDDRPWASWRDLSGLSGRQRSAYEGCLTTAWDREERARGSAPTATPSPTTSARPTDAPSPTPTH